MAACGCKVGAALSFFKEVFGAQFVAGLPFDGYLILFGIASVAVFLAVFVIRFLCCGQGCKTKNASATASSEASKPVAAPGGSAEAALAAGAAAVKASEAAVARAKPTAASTAADIVEGGNPVLAAAQPTVAETPVESPVGPMTPSQALRSGMRRDQESGRKSPGRRRRLLREQQRQETFLAAMNTVDQASLSTFPGVGAKRVGKIIAVRNEALFTSTDDFLERTQIGSRVMENLVEFVDEAEFE